MADRRHLSRLPLLLAAERPAHRSTRPGVGDAPARSGVRQHLRSVTLAAGRTRGAGRSSAAIRANPAHALLRGLHDPRDRRLPRRDGEVHAETGRQMPAHGRADVQRRSGEEEDMKHSDDLRHLAECASCRQRFAANVVPFDAERRRERALNFAAAASRLENERDETADVAARHLRDTPQSEWPRLAESTALRNNAALEQLSDEVRKRLDRDPAQALAIANLAAAIAETIPASPYPPLVIAQIRS